MKMKLEQKAGTRVSARLALPLVALAVFLAPALFLETWPPAAQAQNRVIGSATTSTNEFRQATNALWNAIVANGNRVVTVADLDELAALPFSASYKFAVVEEDLDGVAGLFFWDATIVAADAVENSIVPLDGGTGGFRRKGVL